MAITISTFIYLLAVTMAYGLKVAWATEELPQIPNKIHQSKLRSSQFRPNQEVITITPAPTECLVNNIFMDGLGPCKHASRANFGSIVIRFSSSDQAAFIGIMANAPKSTKIKLICTDLTNVAMYSQSGKIASVADLPRIEMGSMQLVIISSGGPATAKCNWLTY